MLAVLKYTIKSTYVGALHKFQLYTNFYYKLAWCTKTKAFIIIVLK